MNQQPKRDIYQPLVRLARRMCRHPLKILLFTIALSAASVVITAGLRFTTDLTALLPDDHPDLQILRKIQNKYPSEATFMVLASKNYLFVADSQGTVHIHDNTLWHKHPLGRPLHAVWGRSATEAYAAGDGGGLWRYDAKKWTLEKTGSEATLRGLWGEPSGKSLLAIGDGGTILAGGGGAPFARQTSGTGSTLRAIHGAVGKDGRPFVTIVGDGGVVLTGDGKTWRAEKSGTTADLLGVWCEPGGVAFAVGDGGVILKREAGRWKALSSPTRKTLRSIWGESPKVLDAVGDGGVAVRLLEGKAALEDTTTTADLRSIVGLTADLLWTAGDDCQIRRRIPSRTWYHGPYESREKDNSPLARCSPPAPCKASFTAIWRPPNDMKRVQAFVPRLAEMLRKSPLVGRVTYSRPVAFFKDRGLYYLSIKELRGVIDEIDDRLEKETAKGTGLYIDLEDDEDDEDGGEEKKDPSKDRMNKLYEKYGDLAERYGKTSIYMHHDGSSAGIVVHGKPGVSGLGDKRRLRAEIEKIVAASGYKKIDPLMQLHVGGDAVNKIREYQTTIDDILGLAWLAVAGIVLMLLLYFRRLVGLLFVVLPLGMSITWTFGLTTLVIGQLNIVTGFLFAVLFGLGIDYGLQLFGRYRESRLAGLSIEESLDRMVLDTGRATLTSAITSAAAMLTLTITEFRGFSEFGFIAGLGILFAMCSFMLVLPSLIQLTERLGILRLDRGRAARARAREGRGILAMKLRRPVVALGLAAAAFGAYGVYRAQFEYDHSLLRPGAQHDEIRYRAGYVFGGSFTPTQFLADSREELIAGLEAVDLMNRRLGKKSKVRKTMSILALVPPRQPEKAELLKELKTLLASKRWNLVSDEKRKQIQLDQLRRMAGARPFSVKDLPESVRRSFRGPGFGDSWIGLVFYQANMSDTRDARKFRAQVGSFPGSKIVNLGRLLPKTARSAVDGKRVEIVCPGGCPASLVASLKGLDDAGRPVFAEVLTHEAAVDRGLVIDRERPHTLLAIAAEGFVPRVGMGVRTLEATGPFHVSSHEVVITEVVEVMLRDSRIAFAMALGVVFLACLLDFRSLRWAMLACLPVSLGLLWIFGAMHLLKMKLNMFNFVMLPVLVGIGIDYGIHYVHRYREEGARGLQVVMRNLFWVILFCSATTIVGFGNMAFALHPGLASLGNLAIIGLVTMFLTSSFVLPAFLALRKQPPGK